MSNSSLRFHAVDPAAVLDPAATDAVTSRLHAAFPGAGAVDVVRYDATQCIDNGANLDRVMCPSCGDEIDDWGDLMSAAWDGQGLADLAVVTSCCSTATTLDQLTYEWPLGFGRFVLEVHEPGSAWFTPHRDVPAEAVELLADLIELTGHRLGVVWRHL